MHTGLTNNKEELREKVRKAAAASECRAVEELMRANTRHHDVCDKLHTYKAAHAAAHTSAAAPNLRCPKQKCSLTYNASMSPPSDAEEVDTSHNCPAHGYNCQHPFHCAARQEHYPPAPQPKKPLGKVPVYKGSNNIRGFFQMFDHWCKAGNLSDQDKVEQLGSAVQDDA